MLYCSFQLMDIYMAMQCAGTVWFARPDALKVSSLPLSSETFFEDSSIALRSPGMINGPFFFII